MHIAQRRRWLAGAPTFLNADAPVEPAPRGARATVGG
jgi:hypothetical protein